VRWWKILDAGNPGQVQGADAGEQRVVAWEAEVAEVT
jgi:hypothetical protein